MWRRQSRFLDQWLTRKVRKPLILRGARQVGKTWLVRDLASRSERELLEINFERDPALESLFEPNDPAAVIANLELFANRSLADKDSLLFLDEIQAAPQVIAKLRWFAEERPELPVVAAGSLLEFALAESSFSVPVGRVTYLHVEPMTFEEYLRAHDRTVLLEALQAYRVGSTLADFAHGQATQWFHRYVMVGGMPAVVAADLEGSARRCREAQLDLAAAFRDDFAKYAGRREPRQLDKVLVSVVGQLGSKFVYSRVDEGMRHAQAKMALELLVQAQLCSLAVHTSARGAPLAAGAKSSDFKAFLLDMGLVHALLRTPAAEARFPALASLPPSLRGQLMEQVVYQALRSAFDAPLPQELYYWHRTGGRAGEIDFVTQRLGGVLPVEVKAGSSGAMKALHQFMAERHLPCAVRFDENPPSLQDVSVATTQSLPVSYQLLSLPHYLAWNLNPVLEAWQ